MNLRGTLIEDAAWYGDRSLRTVVAATLRHRTFRPVLTLRLYQAARNPLTRTLARYAHHRACQSASIDLWPGTEVGAGFKITHGWAAVVNPRTVLGSDVVMMHGVTLGQRGRSGGCPVIGDRVLLGPGAIVLGAVKIGDGATVSAGCVVVDDVPADTLVRLDSRELVTSHHVRPFGKDNPAPG